MIPGRRRFGSIPADLSHSSTQDDDAERKADTLTRVLALLLLVLLVLVVLQRAWLAFTRTPAGRGVVAVWRGLAGAGPMATPRGATAPDPGGAEPVRLLRCTSCGVHVPESEALPKGAAVGRAPLCQRCRATGHGR